ncbi:trypsin-like peptidase domain-containing protein [Streptomyces sp. NPDC051597]|uniref:trypsin-like peptidase domain-containing protein n=1 Tax=Streptomyces sp. NPDC051597 TaxID=3155049 RepID=UPI003447FB9B
MNDGKPTGPRARWWSRPTPREDGSAAEETYDLAPPEGGTPDASAPGAQDGPAAAAPEGSGARDVPYPLAPGAPVEEESAYRLAPPAPAAPADSAQAVPADPVQAVSAQPGPVASVDSAQAVAAEPGPVAPADPAQAVAAEPGHGPTPVEGVDPGPAPAERTAPQLSASAEPTALQPSAPAEPTAPQPSAPSAAAEVTAQASAAAAEGPGDGSARNPDGAVPLRRPLHAPDPYGTPPYGGPGPWAPAPPVQRPAPLPGAVPPAAAVPSQGAYPAPEAPAPAPYVVPEAVPPVPPSSQWVHYDPWGAAGQQPLSTAGAPARRGPRRGALVLGAVVLALVAGGIGGGIGAYVERTGTTHVSLPQAGKGPIGRAPDSVAGIAASALPGVVTLHVSGESESGTGTGFVLDNAGHILTNNHVVQPAGSSGDISVTFSGGESARATVVGRDSGYDLAVVRVTGVSGLKPLPLGNSDNVQVGDPVVAIGAPFDLSNTVTSGIISAKERPITAGGEKGDGSDVSYVDALQTDAPINPGNSGGPLLDSRAHVVGINSAIRAAGSSDSGGQGGSIGLGFAIPVNQGKRVAEELINTGRATHPVIGVTLDMKFSGDGARVGAKAADGKPSVTPGGPGATAGIRPEDVITKVDGQRVHSAEELIVKIRAHRPGDRLELTLRRGGQEQRLTLILGSATS